ncbi:30S ribosomal protein S2 [Patescibacteria group bacterium]
MAVKKTDTNYEISLQDLLEAGSHFGHQAKRWNPKMKPYIWQARDGVHIFDLVKTKDQLVKACEAAKEMVKNNEIIVMVGTKRQAKAIIKEEALKAGMPYVTHRWLGGTITNWGQIETSIKKLNEMKEKTEKGEYKKYTKKENILIQREIARLEKIVGGLTNLKKTPEAIFVVDAKREYAAVKEANMKGIKVFAIVDSNCDPENIDYLIPANDDAVRSIKLLVGTFAKAVADGVNLRGKKK